MVSPIMSKSPAASESTRVKGGPTAGDVSMFAGRQELQRNLSYLPATSKRSSDAAVMES